MLNFFNRKKTFELTVEQPIRICLDWLEQDFVEAKQSIRYTLEFNEEISCYIFHYDKRVDRNEHIHIGTTLESNTPNTTLVYGFVSIDYGLTPAVAIIGTSLFEIYTHYVHGFTGLFFIPFGLLAGMISWSYLKYRHKRLYDKFIRLQFITKIDRS